MPHPKATPKSNMLPHGPRPTRIARRSMDRPRKSQAPQAAPMAIPAMPAAGPAANGPPAREPRGPVPRLTVPIADTPAAAGTRAPAGRATRRGCEARATAATWLTKAKARVSPPATSRTNENSASPAGDIGCPSRSGRGRAAGRGAGSGESPGVGGRAELETRPAGAAQVDGRGPHRPVDRAADVEGAPVDVARARIEAVDQPVACAERGVHREVEGAARQARSRARWRQV